jgi:tungstate transport system ATP-binding protein
MSQTILPLALRDIVFEAGGQRLLSGISASIGAEGRTVVLGPNGAGKSLTLRIAHGLLAPTSGSVDWHGQDPKWARSRQAMLFERPVLLRRSALANVEYGLSLRGLRGAARRSRALEYLARTGLERMANRPARVLSAGEQQRLTLARCWATQPELLFLDEPTAALDPAATRAVEAIIDSIALAGTKIVMTTHDMAQARRLADDVLFLYRGRLLERGPAKGFFEAPQCEEAQAFIRGELLW